MLNPCKICNGWGDAEFCMSAEGCMRDLSRLFPRSYRRTSVSHKDLDDLIDSGGILRKARFVPEGERWGRWRYYNFHDVEIAYDKDLRPLDSPGRPNLEHR